MDRPLRKNRQRPRNKMEGMIYGVHPVLEALESGQEVDRIFVTRGRQESVNPILEAAKERGIHVKFVPVEKLQRLTKKNHQGVIAFLSAVSFAELDHVVGDCYERGETPLIVVLDRVTDVRNVGAIARSAECCGAHALVIPEQQSAPMNADAVKSSAGALLRLPICRVKNLSHALADLENSGLSIVGCTEKGDSLLAEADFTLPLALVLGSEEDGISPAVWKGCRTHAKIPTIGELGSLNVSVAAGMALYEVLRQRG